MKSNHPIHGSDDAACRWLALSAGKRSRTDERELEQALEALDKCRVKPLSEIDMLRRVK